MTFAHARRTTIGLVFVLLAGGSADRSAQAQTTFTYTGNATGAWSVAGNWDANGVPPSGDATILNFNFTSPSAAATLTQDLADPFILNQMVISSNANVGITFTGGALQFSGTDALLRLGVTSNPTVTVQNAIVIGGSGMTIMSATNGGLSNTSSFVISGAISTTSSGATILTLTGAATQSGNSVRGAITDGVNGGTVGIFKTGSGVWTVSNNGNTFSGGITVEQGSYFYDGLADLGNAVGALTLGTANNLTGTFNYLGGGAITFTRDLHLGGTGVMTFAVNATGTTASTGGQTIFNSNLVFDDSTAKNFRLVAQNTSTNAVNDFQSLLTNPVGSTLGLWKSGNGTWLISNTANDFTGGISIQAGHLRFTDSAALNLANNNIRFVAGVSSGTSSTLQTSGSLTNSLGAGAGQIQFLTGSGGFSAFGGDLHVTLNDNATTAIVWGGNSGATKISSTSELNLSAVNADGVTYFHNALQLTGSTNATRTHRINVVDNPFSTADYAVIDGVISNSGGITKTGNGLLVLSGANTFSGGVTIYSGSIQVSSTTLNLNLPAQALRFGGTNNGTSGALQTSGVLNFAGLGTAAGQVSWLADSSGGFAAVGGTLSVTLTTDTVTPIVWGSTSFFNGAGEMVLSSTSADNVVTWNNAIDFGGAARNVRILDNTTTTADYAVIAGAITNGGLTKIGAGLLQLTGVNDFSGGVTVQAGVLRVADPQSSSLNAATTQITFTGTTAGAILEGAGSITSGIGIGAGMIAWGLITPTNTASGSGGFSAYGGALNVTLDNNAATALTWNGPAGSLFGGGELQFGSIYSDNVVTFNNAINLSDGVHTVRVVDNPDSTADMAVLTGAISSPDPTLGGLIKQGTGTLVLTADSTYTGTTTVAGGLLQLGDGGTTGIVMGNIRLTNSTVGLAFNHSSIVAVPGIISGAGSVTIAGPSTGGVIFNGANTLTGTVALDAGTMQLGADNIFGTLVSNLGTTIDLNGFAMTLTTLSDGLSGGGLITNNGVAQSLITLSQGLFTGAISEGTGTIALVKLGAGTLTLNGSNNFSGGLTIGGTGVLFVPDGSYLGSGPITFSGGQLQTGVADLTITAPLTLSGGMSLGGATTFTFDSAGMTSIVAAATLTNASTLGTSGVVFADDFLLGANLTLTGDNDFTILGNINVTGGSWSITTANIGGHTFNDVNLAFDGIANNLTLRGLTPLVVAGAVTDGGLGGGVVIAAGTVSLSSTANSYTGGTTLLGGTLLMTDVDALPGLITGSGGTLDPGTAPRTLENDIVLLGTFNLTGDQLLTFNGDVTNSGGNRTIVSRNTAGAVFNGTITLGEGAVSRSLGISGTGGVVINGVIQLGAGATSGSVNVSNTSAAGVVFAADNTFSGRVSIQAGARLIVGTGGTAGTIPGLITSTGTLEFNRSDVYVYGGVIGGAGSVVLAGPAAGGVQFDAANTYTGFTTLNTDTILKFGINSAIAPGSKLALNSTSTVDLNGFVGTVAQLIDDGSGGGRIINNGATLSTLTISSTALDSVFAGVIQDGTGSLAINKAGAGRTLTLSGTNAYSGGTRLVSGNLAITNDSALGTGTLTLAGGVFDSGVGNRTLSVPLSLTGSMTITGDGNITFNGAANNTLTIANLTLANTGTFAVVNPIAPAGAFSLTNNGGGTATIGGLTAIPSTLTFNGTAPIVISGSSDVTATTTFTNNNASAVTFHDFNLTGLLTLTGSTPFAFDGTFLNNTGNRTLSIRTTGTTTFHDIKLSEVAATRSLTIWSGEGAHIVIDGNIYSVNSNTSGLTFTGSPTEAPGGTINITGSSALTRTLVIGGNGRTYTVKSGATFPMTLNAFSGGSNTFVVENGASVGNMSFRLTPSGSIVEMYGTMTNGTVSLTGAGSRFTVHSGGSMGNGAITLVDDNTFEIESGATVGNGAVTMLGTATFILNGNKGTGNGSLDTGSILTGAGRSNGTWTMAAGSHLFVGGLNSVGTMTLGSLILNGGTIRFDLGTSSDLLRLNTLPTINGATTLNIANSGGFGIGDYTLFSGYTGTMANIGNFNVIAPVGFKNSLEAVDGALILHILAATTKTWTGSVDNVWDNDLTANFTDGSTAVTYSNGDADAVNFFDGAANTSITIANGGLGLAPTSVLVDNSATTYTFAGEPITGGAQLSKRGDGLLVILNNNTFTGGIQISGGTVQLGDGGTTGQLDPTSIVALNNGASLVVDRSDTLTLTGNIGGTGNLVMNGSGTLQIAGFNSHVGNTVVNDGTLELVGAGVLSEFGSWTVNPTSTMSILSSTNQTVDTIDVNGGNLGVNFSVAARAITATTINLTNGGTITSDSGSISVRTLNLTSGTINLNGSATTLTTILTSTLGGGGLGETAVINLAANTTLSLSSTLVYAASNDALVDPNGALISGPGRISFSGVRTITVNDSANAVNDLTISADINLGAFVKNGAGTLYLQGNNTTTAANSIQAGTVVVGNANAFGTGAFNLSGGATMMADGTPRTLNNLFNLRGAAIIGGTSALTLSTVQNVGNQTLTINNTAKTTINELRLAEGDQARTLTLRGTGEVDIALITAGSGTGNDNIVFDGQGVYNLFGANTYTGITSIRDGQVRVFNDAAFGLSNTVNLGVIGAVTRTALLLLDGGLTLTNDLHASDTGTSNSVLAIGGLTNVSSTFAGNITLSQNLYLYSATGGTQYFTGAIASGGTTGAGFTVTGGGTVVLTGNNIYTGTAVVAEGVLLAGSTTALGAASKLQVEPNGLFDLNGFSNSVGTLVDGVGGLGVVTNNGAAATISVGGGLFTGTLAGGANLSLVKNTTGTLTLAGTNTYTGTTLVSDGVLLVTGTLASPNVSVDAAGTLGGSGFLAGTVTSSGTISPGTSPGTLTMNQLVLNGGNLNFELDTIAGSDQIVLTGGSAPTVNNATALNFTALSNFDEGIYSLITGYSGTTLDNSQLLLLSGSVPTTLSGLNVSLTSVDGSVNLVVSTTHLTWNAAATNAWNSTDVNWTDDGTSNPSAFSPMSVVTFSSALSASNNVVVDVAGVAPHHVIVDAATATTFTFSGGDVVGTSLTKIGAGQLVLAGNNTYARGVTISDGELIVGNGAISGNLVGNVVNNALLSFDRSDTYTFAGNISGTGALQQIGTGTLVLTGDNSFTGPTTINAGYFSVQGNYASTIYNNTGVQSTVATNTTGTIALTAPIVGNVQFEQNGSGVTTLSGASTYTGATVVNAGTLVVGDSLNGTASVAVNAGGTFNVASGGTVTTTAGGAITVVGTANVSNSTNNAAVFVANGTINAPVVVQQGGLLKGAGTISGPVVVQTGAGLAPGNSVDSQIMSGGITLSQGSSLYFDFRDADGTTDFNGGDPGGTGAGYGWDLIDLQTGILNLGDATAVNTIDLYINAYKLDNSGHATLAGEVNFDPQSNYSWLFIKVDSLSQLTTNGTDDDFSRRFNVIDNLQGELELGGVFDIPSNNPFDRPLSSLGMGTFTVSWDSGVQGSGLYIHYSAIPEPGSMILAGLASLGAGWYGRRRMRRGEKADAATTSEAT